MNGCSLLTPALRRLLLRAMTLSVRRLAAASHRERRKGKFGLAGRADVHTTAHIEPLRRLEHRFSPILVAALTQQMRWFGALSLRLQGISKNASPNLGKLIPLLLSFPCFEVSHFFFKLAYALNQRRLRRLCGEDLFLKLYDRRIATGDIVDVLESLREIKGSLDRAQASDELGRHGLPPSNRAPDIWAPGDLRILATRGQPALSNLSPSYYGRSLSGLGGAK